jgi:hypothetical protein
MKKTLLLSLATVLSFTMLATGCDSGSSSSSDYSSSSSGSSSSSSDYSSSSNSDYSSSSSSSYSEPATEAEVDLSDYITISNESLDYDYDFGGYNIYKYRAQIINSSSETLDVTYYVYYIDSSGAQVEDTCVYEKVLGNTTVNVEKMVQIKSDVTISEMRRDEVKVYDL